MPLRAPSGGGERSSLLRPLLFLKDMQWHARTLLWEVRSFAKRICVLRDKNNRRVCESRYLPLGPLYEEDALSGRLLLCKKTISRNESMNLCLPSFRGHPALMFFCFFTAGKWEKNARSTMFAIKIRKRN
jgi:hypothetical protein